MKRIESGRGHMAGFDPKKDIVYEDESILVVNKPAGLAVQTRRVTTDDLESALRRYLGGTCSLYVLHRLDQPVEGLLVFAKTKKAAASLSRQLTDGRMHKVYRARVDGTIPAEEGTLTDWLIHDARKNVTRVVDERLVRGARKNVTRVVDERLIHDTGKNVTRIVDKNETPACDTAGTADYARRSKKPAGGSGSAVRGAKKAVLTYRKISADEVEIELQTGRPHQIRAQLAHAGMPIRGDQKYGHGMNKSKLYLSACRLSFVHPETGEKKTFAIEPFERG